MPLQVSISFLSFGYQGTLCGSEVEEDWRSQTGWWILEEEDTLNQLRRAQRDWNCMHRACMCLYQVLCTYIRAVGLIFLWDYNGESWCISNYFACLWMTFLLLGLPSPALIWGLSPCLSVSSFVTSGCCLLKTCTFLKRKYKGRALRVEWVT